MEMISRTWRLRPKRNLRKGFFSVAIDPETGFVTYVGEIIVGVLLWKRRVPIRGTSQVEPKDLRSSNCHTGRAFDLGPARFVVCDPIGPQRYLAAVSVPALPGIRAQAVLCTERPYLDVRSFSAHGHAGGHLIDIYAE